jgi:hypothetical protein
MKKAQKERSKKEKDKVRRWICNTWKCVIISTYSWLFLDERIGIMDTTTTTTSKEEKGLY